MPVLVFTPTYQTLNQAVCIFHRISKDSHKYIRPSYKQRVDLPYNPKDSHQYIRPSYKQRVDY